MGGDTPPCCHTQTERNNRLAITEAAFLLFASTPTVPSAQGIWTDYQVNYILTYIDDPFLRQAVEKQLNKLESTNKFEKAVFYGNNQEFQQETKEEQLVAEGCKRLIANAIILWNYLYISQKLAETPSEEERQSLITRIKQGSIITWQHINRLGNLIFRMKICGIRSPFLFPKYWTYRWGENGRNQTHERAYWVGKRTLATWHFFPVCAITPNTPQPKAT
jgi:hypothetical protein